MKPAHPSVMTPQPLSCVMHHILLPSSSEHGCHRVSSIRPLRKQRIGWGIHGGRKGGGAASLEAASTCETPEGVILICICWGHPFPRARWCITQRKGDGGISEEVGGSPFSWYIIYAVFLSLEHLSCIIYINFVESIVVYPYKYEYILALTWTHCMGNILEFRTLLCFVFVSAKRQISHSVFQCLSGISLSKLINYCDYKNGYGILKLSTYVLHLNQSEVNQVNSRCSALITPGR